MIRKNLDLVIVTLTLILLIFPVASRGAVNSVETILDGRTAFRWGRDFLVWAVHYPEDVVEPWVRASTGGAGDPTGKTAEEFRTSLKMDESTPVLLSFHSYTERTLELKPLSERFFLKTSNGERLAPTSYDSLFDSPVTGLVQGLVFFPPVDGPFELVLLPDRGKELTFEFPEDHDNRLRKEVSLEVKNKSKEELEIEAQEIKLQAEETRRKELEENQKQWQEEKISLLKKIEALSSQKNFLRHRLDETLARLAMPQKPLFADNKPETVLPEPETSPKEKIQEPVAPGFSRNQVVALFLVAWKKGDTEEMLSFLTPAFREEVKTTKDLNALLKLKALPAKLPGDARLEDDGKGTEARVVFAQKLLVVRTLRSATLKLSEFGRGWYISSFE